MPADCGKASAASFGHWPTLVALPEPQLGDDAGPIALIMLPLQRAAGRSGVLVLSRESVAPRFRPADVTVAEALAVAGGDRPGQRPALSGRPAGRPAEERVPLHAGPRAAQPAGPDPQRRYRSCGSAATADPDVEWAREVIDRQVTHLVRLVDDLLDVSRITRGKIRLRAASAGSCASRGQRRGNEPAADRSRVASI